jgi:hypothetical protein
MTPQAVGQWVAQQARNLTHPTASPSQVKSALRSAANLNWNNVDVRHEASPGREGVEDLLSCAVAAA